MVQYFLNLRSNTAGGSDAPFLFLSLLYILIDEQNKTVKETNDMIWFLRISGIIGIVGAALSNIWDLNGKIAAIKWLPRFITFWFRIASKYKWYFLGYTILVTIVSQVWFELLWKEPKKVTTEL